MGRYCLCSIIRPVFKLAKYFGILPLNEQHAIDEGKGYSGRSCNLTHSFKSIPSILNSILLLLFIIPLPFAFSHIKTRFSNVFKGTDLYAFSFQVTGMFLQSTVLIGSGRLFKSSFAKGWNQLNRVYLSMCDGETRELYRLKIYSYLISGIIIFETIGFYIFNIWIQGTTSMSNGQIQQQGIYENAGFLIVGVFILTLTTIIPNVLCIFFLFICLLVRYHFLKITDMLKMILIKPSEKLPGKIDALRVLHEQLCQAVLFFEDFFGVQLLLILCVCCFTGTIGAYACILQGEGLSFSSSELWMVWGIHLYSAVFFILVILISGQMVTNSALSPALILNEVTLTDYDQKTQNHIQIFLHKLSAFPTNIKALKIANVSTSFLAAAATNTTTYLLVLMQFKLSLERDELVTNCQNITSSE